MADIDIRIVGQTGRITLRRPKSLNSLTGDMICHISAILPKWIVNNDVKMIVIDAEEETAFCAGGDIVEIYAALTNGDFETPRAFWRREYALNAALFHFPKPVASFMQGFTMGGGVGVGCHASHRVVGASSKIAMPECNIGLVPDVGGTLLLARAPALLGEYLGTTATRMGPGDAIFAGFADYFIKEEAWPALIADLEKSGDWDLIDAAAQPAPDSKLAGQMDEINHHFAGDTLRDVMNTLTASSSDFARNALAKLDRNAPLAMACAVELVHRARGIEHIEQALTQEYRFVHRILAQGDFREGIRAAIIDKDRAPKWAHDTPSAPSMTEVASMLMPLGAEEWRYTP